MTNCMKINTDFGTDTPVTMQYVMSSHTVKNLEASKTSVALFLDLSKAFDTLDHDLLLHKWKDMV